MVSLENTKNPKGGFSFEAITPTNDDFIETVSNHNVNTDTLPLTVEIEPNFKQIGTTFGIIMQLLTVIVLEGCVFLIPYLCGDKDEMCKTFNAFDIASFVHGGYWIIKFCFDRFYHYHHMKSKRNGYLEFYRITRLKRWLPLIIISAGNSALVVLIKVLEKYCPVECTSANLKPIHFLQIFVSLENLLLLPILLNYLVVTIKFNKSRKSPDINKEIDRPIFLPSQLKDVGYKDSTFISNILENQADMIRYLQERNEKLSQKLYQISNKANIPNIN